MEQGGISRWLFVGLLALLAVVFVPRLWGNGEEPQARWFEPDRALVSQKAPQICEIRTDSFLAKLSSRGASLQHFELTQPKYTKQGHAIDLSTTPDVPLRQQLRFDWRNPAAHDAPQQAFESTPEAFYKAPFWQVDWDLADFKITESTGTSCTFVYQDQKALVTQRVSATGRPFELEVKATIKNLADRKLRHALTVHTTAWRTDAEVKGGMFRVSPFVTHVECVTQEGKPTRLGPDGFDNKKMSTPPFAPSEFERGGWYDVPAAPDAAAVANAYFAHAILPVSSPVAPHCQLLVEKLGLKEDPLAGAMYRARLAYPKVELEPNQSAEYVVQSYVGPKERDILAQAGGGSRKLGELIDLGFFSIIAKVLVAFLLKVHSVVPNWGIAIISLTVTARVLLFPLSIPMIRSSAKMREIKPEMDALNEKYKDDPQQRGLAQMELWRKHKVNPVKGCLPQMVTMPVWFALYTTLQTAVELYNIPFLWFPDLTAPDPYFILPFIIGGTSYFQQKMMPMTGGDPAQQKMMQYMMPGMFTVFMLFLPAGLGVYMFTNSLLGIGQQQLVEWHIRRSTQKRMEAAGQEPAAPSPGKGRSKSAGPRSGKSQAKSDDSSKLSDSELGKGKA